MGDFSRNTFDRVKHYIGVRLQQGVPLVDADWNELEDIRRYEVQAFLKWFVGDGVPADNEGFRIAALAGGGIGTIVLAATAAPGSSRVAVDVATSTASSVLGFSAHNCEAVSRRGAARLTGDASQPFTLAAGMTLVISADGTAEKTVAFAATDFADISSATAAEVVAVINAAAAGVTATAGGGDDFIIHGGDGTSEGAGRCLVDGRDAIHEGRMSFSSQQLYANNALAAEWGVPVLAQIAPPATGSRSDLVHLDVWEREVTAAEDDALVNPVIGVESSTRLRREWVVRVRPDSTGVPVPGDPDHRSGHSYLPLAQLHRRAGSRSIVARALTDVRPRNLLVPPSTIIEDAFGAGPEAYRRGENRPLISLRDAINALLHGQLPSTPDTVMAPAAARDFMSTAFTVVEDEVVALWHSLRDANVNQVYLTRWPVRSPAVAATNQPVQVTAGPVAHAAPSVVVLPDGQLVVVYETGQQDITARRGTPGAVADAQDLPVAASSLAERQPCAVVAGDLVVFFWQQITATTRRWMYRRWRHTDSTFLDAAPLQLSGTNAALLSGSIGDFSAAVDHDGDIWAAFRADGGGGNFSIRLVRLNPATATPSIDEQTISTGSANEQPFVLVDGTEAVWVFWRSGTDPASALSYQRVPLPAPLTGPAPPPLIAVSASSPARPAALRDDDDAVWLFWSQAAGTGGSRSIWLQRYVKETNSWGTASQLTGGTAGDDQPVALLGPRGAMLMFWLSNRTGNLDIFSKQIITAI